MSHISLPLQHGAVECLRDQAGGVLFVSCRYLLSSCICKLLIYGFKFADRIKWRHNLQELSPDHSWLWESWHDILICRQPSATSGIVAELVLCFYVTLRTDFIFLTVEIFGSTGIFDISIGRTHARSCIVTFSDKLFQSMTNIAVHQFPCKCNFRSNDIWI